MIQKAVFSIILIIGLTSFIFAQTVSDKNIEGIIIEAATQVPMEFVTVVLQKYPTQKMVDGTTTNESGEFYFSNISTGEYVLEISFIGFQTKTTPPFSISPNQSKIDLGNIVIEIDNNTLTEVEVTTEKSTFNNSIDRKIYNVEKDLLAQTSSASEVLQNIPSVDVDVNGTVSLRGTSNITFFINGKPSALMRANSASALQQIPANTIERIEVITNPSAKFKPDGVGGIINIVLKKETRRGFNGTFIGNVGTDERFNANLTLNYNTGKANVFWSYGIRQTNRTRTREELRISKDSIGEVLQNYLNTSSAFVKPISHVFNAGWDYMIDDKNSIGLTGTYYFQDAYQDFSSNTTFTDAVDAKTSAFESTRINDEFEKEYEGGIAFDHQFKKEDHSLGLEFNFSGYDEQDDNVYNDNFTFPNISNLRIRNLIEKTGTVYEAVVEYALPIAEDIELEAGYEGEFVKDDIRFLGEIFNASNETWSEDANRTNQFIFNQNVHAAYVTYGQSIEDFSFLAGLRAEQVLINSNLVTSNLQIPNNYFKLYPTLHLEYEMSDAASMQLNYSRRVNRADSDEHNPFGEYDDPRSKEAGNPKLKPEQVHSVEMGYHLTKERFSFLSTFYYRYKYDAFTEIQTIIEDTVLLTTHDNLATEQSTGLELIFSTRLQDIVGLNFSTNIFYNTIDASNLGFSNKKSNVTFNSKLATNITFTKSTFAQINLYYRSARLTPQGTIDPRFLVNVGLRQDIFKKKASLTFTMSDVFKTLRYDSLIDTPQLFQEVKNRRNARVMYVGLVFHFGGAGKKGKEELRFEDKI